MWSRWLRSFQQLKYKKKNLYWSNLKLVVSVTLIPTLVIAVAVYLAATIKVEREVNLSHLWQVQHLMNKIDENLNQLEMTVSQFAINPLFGESLKNIVPSMDYEYVHDMYRTFLLMKGTNPLIQQIVLYSQPHQATFTEQGFNKLKDEKTANDLQRLLENERTFFWSDLPESYKGSAFSKMLVLKVPVNQDAFGMIMVLLDASKVQSMFNDSLTSAQDFTLVMENGEFIASGGDLLDPQLFLSFLKQSIDQPGIRSINGEKYSVASTTMPRLNESWVYSTGTPLSRVTKPIKEITNLIIAICLIGLFLALLLSWLVSLRIYKPIDKLMFMLRPKTSQPERNIDEIEYIVKEWEQLLQENNMIEQKLNKSMPELKQGLFIQMLNGHLPSLTEAELRSKLVQLEWDSINNHFLPLVVMLGGVPNKRTSFTKGDEPLISFAATNIIDELANKRFRQARALNNQDKTVSLLIAVPETNSYEQTKQELFQLYEDMVYAINSLLKLEVTVSVGRTLKELKVLPQEMQLVREYLKYRDVTKENQILDIDNITPAEQTAYFPVQIETQIVQAIQLGQGEEALVLIRSFWEDVERKSQVEMEILLDMQILLGSIERAILKAGLHPYNLYKGKNLFDELNLNQLKNKDEILDWFSRSVIDPYIQKVIATQNLKKKQMIDKVLDLIQKEYMNDISLEKCAEHVGTLPYTLSKTFKQVTGTTFVVYITGMKIEKCKELIITTNMLLNEVAKEVGWHPAYFNKIFKTYEGLTPGQFREKYS